MGILRKVETLIRSEELEWLRDLPSAEIVRLGRLASLTEERVKKLGLKSDSSASSFYPREKTCKDATDNIFAARYFSLCYSSSFFVRIPNAWERIVVAAIIFDMYILALNKF